MESYLWVLPLLMLAIILWHQHAQQQTAAAVRLFRRRASGKERKQMIELAKQFIGKECIVYTLGSGDLSGVVLEVSDSGLLLENKGNRIAVNLDYVVKLQEYPRNKKGKKKAVVVE